MGANSVSDAAAAIAEAPFAAALSVPRSGTSGKAPRVRVDGVLLLDKPQGLTSTAALARAKRALNAAKAGHTGTLDPMATGLLPLCFGEATKFAADLLEADKSYEATLQLGATTTTGDAEGEIVEVRPCAIEEADLPAKGEAALARFRGEIEQVPPMYSALKRDGKPLYAYARAGLALERAARRVAIRRLELVDVQAGEAGSVGPRLLISVDCGKGTYIRTLAEDIGAALGCGAHLVALRRTRAGALDLAQAVPLAAFEEASAAERPRFLLPVDALLTSLPRVVLDETESARFVQGQRLATRDSGGEWAKGSTDGAAGGAVRVYRALPGGDTLLLGTGELLPGGVLAPQRVMVRE